MSGHTCKHCGHESRSVRMYLRTWIHLNPWPAAFVGVLGGVPLVVFGVAVTIVYWYLALPALVLGGGTLLALRESDRRKALAARADERYSALAAIVAQPLPPMPTEPVPMHEAPTTPRGALIQPAERN